MSNKKEIRVYFNLTKLEDTQIYDYINSKNSSSSYIKNLVIQDMEKSENNNIIANKLDLVISAINNLNTISILPVNGSVAIQDQEVNFDLKDQFDDDY